MHLHCSSTNHSSVIQVILAAIRNLPHLSSSVIRRCMTDNYVSAWNRVGWKERVRILSES